MVLYTTGFVNLLSLGGGDLGSLLCEFSRPPVPGGEPARPVLGRRPGCWGSGSPTRLQESPHAGPCEAPRSSSGADARVGTPSARRSPSRAVPACPPLGPAVLQSCGGKGGPGEGCGGRAEAVNSSTGLKRPRPGKWGTTLAPSGSLAPAIRREGDTEHTRVVGGPSREGGPPPQAAGASVETEAGIAPATAGTRVLWGGGGDRSALCPPAQRASSSSYSSWRRGPQTPSPLEGGAQGYSVCDSVGLLVTVCRCVCVCVCVCVYQK